MLLTNSNMNQNSLTKILVGPDYLNSAFTTSRASAGWWLDGGVLRQYGNNVPRLSQSGLLIEGQQTNAIPNSSAFPAGFTAISGGTGTAPTSAVNDLTFAAPDGTFTATRVTLNVGAGTSASDFSGWERTVTSGVNSIWVRTVSGTATVQIGNSLTTGHTSIGTTWTRYFRTGGTTTLFRVLGLGSLTNGTIELLVWQPQAEAAGTVPSSEIPTTAGAVTRLRDTISGSTAPFNTAGGGVFYGRVTLPFLLVGRLLGMTDGTASNRWYVESNAAGQFNIVRTNLTVSSTTSNVQTYTAGASFGIAISFSTTGEVFLSINGATRSFRSGAPASSVYNTILMGETMLGVWNQLRFRPINVSDAELRALSTFAF